MAEFCKKCWLSLNAELTEGEIIETDDTDFCEKCGNVGKVVAEIIPKLNKD